MMQDKVRQADFLEDALLKIKVCRGFATRLIDAAENEVHPRVEAHFKAAALTLWGFADEADKALEAGEPSRAVQRILQQRMEAACNAYAAGDTEWFTDAAA